MVFLKTMWRTDKMPFWMRCDIRHLKENDLDAVKKLSNEELPVQYSDAWFHRICENDADEYLAIGCFNQHLYGFIAIDREYYKNELKRKPNRCSAFEKELSVEAKEQMSYVVSVAVCKEFQNMGIATELMRMAIELLKEETKPNVIYLHVLVDNEPALKLYSKFGFVNRHTNDQYLIVRPEEFRAAHIFVKKLDV
ncbi:hypothetical protein QR680_007666 [Steinernema hermaphroditum]|uniref:N-alpha-acetyltransferase 60 n=1 Tax=Steinernema hermaphroditum TaxID=289476 RepID=A0AA39IDW5_9BILA|nr:hypothetical protein QR680_007666 [Steinernema hermaphroditum]